MHYTTHFDCALVYFVPDELYSSGTKEIRDFSFLSLHETFLKTSNYFNKKSAEKFCGISYVYASLHCPWTIAALVFWRVIVKSNMFPVEEKISKLFTASAAPYLPSADALRTDYRIL